MIRKPVPATVLAAALSACVVESELLNSERIEQRFGSYGIEVLSSRNGVRRSNLYSMQDGRKVCRTYAVVHFDDVPDSILDREHAQILAGQSIGAIFRANGWEVFKETRVITYHAFADENHPVLQLMGANGNPSLGMHIYRLLLKKESQLIDYASIIEVHHPDYLGLDELRALYLSDDPEPLTESELAAARLLVDDTDW